MIVESYSFMKEIIIFYMPLEPVVALAFMFFYIKSEACNNNIRDCHDYYAALRPCAMLMYGKEASNGKQEIDCQHHTIPNQRSQSA